MRKTRLLNTSQGAVLSLLAGMLLSCTNAGPNDSGPNDSVVPSALSRTITGVVTYANAAPFPGATVFVLGTQIQTVTAADGSFTLSGIVAPEVTLAVHGDRYGRRERLATATLSVGSKTSSCPESVKFQTIVNDPTTIRTIRGTVADQTTGALLEAAMVIVGDTGLVAFTETDGAFAIYDVPTGATKLTIQAPDYETRVVDMPANIDSISIQLALAKIEVIVIQALDPVITSN